MKAPGAALFSVLLSAWRGVFPWAPLGCAQAVPETMVCDVGGTSRGTSFLLNSRKTV